MKSIYRSFCPFHVVFLLRTTTIAITILHTRLKAKKKTSNAQGARDKSRHDGWSRPFPIDAGKYGTLSCGFIRQRLFLIVCPGVSKIELNF